eukprot:CAMPEP_0198541840 /NCGR_PEP_ID=MMETSP1462-20131121/55285_1 /TAXON_ID=1333877 /ORGANISM="Brandtodinium nutriculum, Strain RCC3387" /LENGTH=114 /DNA_ID=CAMNT_0044272027 /DNA_START=47 /DNA_END=388 /DNA_ORIENTATION=+
MPAAGRTALVARGESAGHARGVLEVLRTEPFDVLRCYLDDDGTFPNNSDYPVLFCRAVWHSRSRQEGEAAMIANGWTRPWAWGVFPFHHYHSNAWEALLCVAGDAEVQLGGPAG